MIAQGKSIAFHTFGCKLNFSETSHIMRLVAEKGFRVTDFRDLADYYVIHSCVVTEIAEKKCRALIRSVKKRAPQSKIAIMGCYSELKKEELEASPEIDFVLGTFDKYNLPDLIAASQEKENIVLNARIEDPLQFVPTFSSGDRTRVFLKVQDGCDYFCTFCAIPYARGRSRSNTIEKTLKTARKAIETGAKEIILTGVNVGDFGKHHGENFFQLIQALDAISWDGRIRLSSIEPELLSDDIIEFVAVSKHFMPHFHIPLQSGSDKILKKMHRRYSRALFEHRVDKIKSLLPYACIAVDVITGFPTESEKDFQDSCNFLSRLDISALHVFTYSQRNGTPAAKMEEQVPMYERRMRSKALQRLSNEKKAFFTKNNIGRFEKVLFEAERSKGFMYGFTKNYIRVATKFDRSMINKEIEIKLEKLNDGNEFIYNP
ncbi:MAG: tRNA (N(6)-L-threonylcarbamoyladenosine(37)-C(2))-methylthiotransferase MtaB [Bacteroidales bacterium]|jgi:threonylcarbamoyladenosine tRNA methylthiotransferase MtaB|nr:tRNA (N(6)-L-threonylcarbamoyladenosine(37)-C(2))-methylthiotransferase MtaB [Bacteroidales bacterium]